MLPAFSQAPLWVQLSWTKKKKRKEEEKKFEVRTLVRKQAERKEKLALCNRKQAISQNFLSTFPITFSFLECNGLIALLKTVKEQ